MEKILKEIGIFEARVQAMPDGTRKSAALERVKAARRIYATDSSSGRDGKIRELLCVPINGNFGKTDVSPAGAPDALLSDKKRSRIVEVKSNGGCLEDIYSLPPTAFVVYTIGHAGNKIFPATDIPPYIFTVQDFLLAVQACNAEKKTTCGKNSSREKKKRMIQWGLKAWRTGTYTAWGVPYDAFRRYTVADGHAQEL